MAVTVWLNEVCIFPVLGLISSGRALTYVDRSFFTPRCSNIFPTIGCLERSFSRISSVVEYCPVFVFLAFSSILRRSNKTSPTCRAELTLNSVPAN